MRPTIRSFRRPMWRPNFQRPVMITCHLTWQNKLPHGPFPWLSHKKNTSSISLSVLFICVSFGKEKKKKRNLNERRGKRRASSLRLRLAHNLTHRIYKTSKTLSSVVILLVSFKPQSPKIDEPSGHPVSPQPSSRLQTKGEEI